MCALTREVVSRVNRIQDPTNARSRVIFPRDAIDCIPRFDMQVTERGVGFSYCLTSSTVMANIAKVGGKQGTIFLTGGTATFN